VDYSANIETVGSQPVFDIASITDAWARFRMDDVVLNGDGSIEVYNDGTGNGRSMNQSNAGLRALPGKLNGQPAAVFDGVDDLVVMPDMSSLTESEIFIIGALDVQPPPAATTSGLWTTGTSGSSVHFPFTDNLVYDDFGSTTRQDALILPFPVNEAFVYHVYSGSFLWAAFLNNAFVGFNTPNTPSFRSSPVFARNASGSQYFKGRLTDMLILDRQATGDEREGIVEYAVDRYGVKRP
jgi:hypothetical protein